MVAVQCAVLTRSVADRRQMSAAPALSGEIAACRGEDLICGVAIIPAMRGQGIVRGVTGRQHAMIRQVIQVESLPRSVIKAEMPEEHIQKTLKDMTIYSAGVYHRAAVMNSSGV